MDRRTVALGLAALAAVAAALAVTLSGGNSKASPEFVASVAYIRHVDAVQQRMRRALADVAAAYHAYSAGKTPDPRVDTSLARAQRTLELVARRLRDIPAPPPAARLRAAVVRLTELEVALAGEVRSLALFTPRFDALVRRSHAASLALSRGLKEVKGPKPHRIHGTRKQVKKAQAAFNVAADRAAAAQASVVDEYRVRVEGLRGQLLRLEAPAVMAPSLHTELRTLRASAAAAAALAAELRAKKRTRVAELGRALAVAARTSATLAAQRANIAAVVAYNRRVDAIGAQQVRVKSELSALQKRVG